MPFKYEVGDKVIIREYLTDGYRSDYVTFVDAMEKYRKKIATISRNYLSDDGLERYRIEEDGGDWVWARDFFDPANEIFIEDNVVLLRNGQIRLVHGNALYLPNGTCIETENYTDRKHNFDENFDIIEVHRRATSNYKFDLSGELIQEEN